MLLRGQQGASSTTGFGRTSCPSATSLIEFLTVQATLGGVPKKIDDDGKEPESDQRLQGQFQASRTRALKSAPTKLEEALLANLHEIEKRIESVSTTQADHAHHGNGRHEGPRSRVPCSAPRTPAVLRRDDRRMLTVAADPGQRNSLCWKA